MNLHWSDNSRNIHWTLGDEYFTNRVSEKFTFLPNSPDTISPVTETGTKIGLELKMDVPKGQIAFTTARIITPSGAKGIETANILVRETTRVGVGPAADVNGPDGA